MSQTWVLHNFKLCFALCSHRSSLFFIPFWRCYKVCSPAITLRSPLKSGEVQRGCRWVCWRRPRWLSFTLCNWCSRMLTGPNKKELLLVQLQTGLTPAAVICSRHIKHVRNGHQRNGVRSPVGGCFRQECDHYPMTWRQWHKRKMISATVRCVCLMGNQAMFFLLQALMYGRRANGLTLTNWCI